MNGSRVLFGAAALLAAVSLPCTAAPPLIPPVGGTDPGFLSFVLGRQMDGQRVMVVEPPDELEHDNPAKNAATKEPLDRLQVIGERQSPPGRPYIPFAVGQSWVLAPQYRDEPVTDFSKVPLIDLAGRTALLNTAIASIPALQAYRHRDMRCSGRKTDCPSACSRRPRR